MTNFEKWKSGLAIWDTMTLFYNNNCSNCPAHEHCTTTTEGTYCHDVFPEWANKEAI